MLTNWQEIAIEKQQLPLKNFQDKRR